uniref:C-type lectin n=1 Tax=Ruditapes philippinarum TaxID=129788 RepID=A0A6B9L4F4_RUDPH|nr:c-type lectin [Ruditapes philippinarum]
MKTVIVLLFVFACLAQGINGKACCSDGWIAYKDHCYHIGYGTGFTFSAARVYCQSLGAYLVRLDTLDENTFLKGFLKKTNAGNTWMGLTDKIHEGIWRWSDTNRHATFSDWGPGEPNNLVIATKTVCFSMLVKTISGMTVTVMTNLRLCAKKTKIHFSAFIKMCYVECDEIYYHVCYVYCKIVY